jgi:hypothetical protein
MINTTVGYQTKSATISNTAKAITHADFSWGVNDVETADRAYITARTSGVMITWTGITPTASLGFYLGSNSNLVVEGNRNIRQLSFIREGGSDATIVISFEKYQ